MKYHEIHPDSSHSWHILFQFYRFWHVSFLYLFIVAPNFLNSQPPSQPKSHRSPPEMVTGGIFFRISLSSPAPPGYRPKTFQKAVSILRPWNRSTCSTFFWVFCFFFRWKNMRKQMWKQVLKKPVSIPPNWVKVFFWDVFVRDFFQFFEVKQIVVEARVILQENL